MRYVKKQSNGSGHRRSFTKEFKADAVSLVLVENRTITDVASSLGVGESTLGKWVQQARIDAGERDGLTTSEKAELVELRREGPRQLVELLTSYGA